MAELLGLTLARPWEAAILYLGKPCENRKWHPGEYARDTRIALHAGMSFEETALPFIERTAIYGGRTALEIAERIRQSRDRHSLIVGTVRLTGWWRHVVADPRSPLRSKNGSDTFGCLWEFGPWVWGLADVFALPAPVPCKGALGLWRVPPDVAAKVTEQEARRVS